MLIRRHLPNGRSNHEKTTKPLIFKGLIGKCRECDQRLNYRPLYTIFTDSQSVTRSALESRTWKQEKTNRNTTAYCVENQRFAEAKTTVLNNGSNSVPALCSYLIISVLDALHRQIAGLISCIIFSQNPSQLVFVEYMNITTDLLYFTSSLKIL